MSYITFGGVIGAMEDAGVDQRDAYWAGGNRPSDGDKRLIILVDGRPDLVVEGIAVVGDDILISTVPLQVASTR